MMRSLAFGIFDGALVIHVLYLVVLAGVGLVLTSKRLEVLFLR
jgi:hypothetical protein